MWPEVAVQPLRHFLEHRAERVDRDLALVAIQDLDEARHVRAFEIVRQVHVHVEIGDRVLLAARAVLDLDRVENVLDADAIDGNAARIGAALHVFHGLGDGLLGFNGGVRVHVRYPAWSDQDRNGTETADLKNFRLLSPEWRPECGAGIENRVARPAVGPFGLG